MALLDRPMIARLAERAEETLGFGLRPTTELKRAALIESEFYTLRDEAEDLAFHAMDYMSGRPSEMAHERRKRIAQRSRVALKFDALARAEGQLLADFAFGKGVPIPTARDEKVQQVIEEAWSDANNEEKLTGFMAQRKLSNELLTTGELFVTLYVAGGRIRVGRLDPDTVEAVVPDPEDRLRPLWYMARLRRFEWDFDNDRAKVETDLMEGGRPKIMYYKHWRNYDDAVAERALSEFDGEQSLITPDREKIGRGVVFHIAVNQTGEELRGNPPWAAALRFFEAMNVLTEAHVVMAQGASTFVARRVMRGSPQQVYKAAASVAGHVSELGAGRLGLGGQPQAEGPTAFAPGAPPPSPPGSWWNENESSKLESLSLNSGAGQMVQTGQIVRAPIAAQSGFGQHYLGDASNANLATASTLELPANMRIESWQELFAQLYRWFTDRAIEAAVKAGRLGGLDGFPEDGPIGEMRLHEAEDRAAMERRTKRDLSYEFVMPFPGRRQLADVSTFVANLRTAIDPNGVSIPFTRQLLRFAYETMGVQNVGRAVEEAIPDKPIPGGIGPQEVPEVMPPGGGDGNPTDTPPAQSTPPEGERPKNVKRQSTPPGERPMSEKLTEEWIPAELRQDVAAFEDETAARFRAMVGDPAVTAALALAAPVAA